MAAVRRAIIVSIIVLTTGIILATARAAPAQDAAGLFREELADATAKLKWRGPELADETRFAVAASGLSWQPLWGATQLIQKGKKGLVYGDALPRANAFIFARRSDAHKEAFAFALSVVLSPPGQDMMAWSAAYDYLAGYGDDFDKALIGVLHAPDRLPLLPSLQYAAAEVLTRRASPRLLPFFLTQAESDDPYLRGRAASALGIIGYRDSEAGLESIEGLGKPLRELGISARQQAMISDTLGRAAEDKSYRVREAAAFALGLTGSEEDLARLEKLAKDPAYLMMGSGPKSTRTYLFPVRHQAAQSLRRLGRMTKVETAFTGKLPRGAKDVTHVLSGIRKDQVPAPLSPLLWP
jgi:hypothetical protein